VLAEYTPGMTTLTEIQAGIDRLPVAQQEELLRHLQARLRRQGRVITPAARREWMQRLSALRAATGSGTMTVSSEQILTELRED